MSAKISIRAIWNRIKQINSKRREGQGDESDELIKETANDLLMYGTKDLDSKTSMVDCQKEREIFAVYFNESTSEGIIGGGAGSKQMKVRGAKFIHIVSSLLQAMNGTMAWLPGAVESLPLPWFFSFVEWNLRSVGQVYFCNSPISGLLILAGIFIQSTHVAVYGLLGLLTGNAVALGLGFDRSLISSGLFGYNSILCGLAVETFKGSKNHGGYDASIMITTSVVSMLSVAFFVALAKILAPYKSPPLTFPFNAATITFLIAVNIMTGNEQPASSDFNDNSSQNLIGISEFFTGVLRGIGQVYLANSAVSSACILIGIALCSRYLALAAFVGSLLGTGFSVLTGADNIMIEQGLYGYNSSLTLAAMAIFFVPSVGSFGMGLLAVIFTVLAQYACAVLFMTYGLPVMTVPFCVITLAMILIQRTADIIISVPLSSITIPEDHLQRVNILKEGFQYLFHAIKASESSRSMQMSTCGKSSELLKKISMEVIELHMSNTVQGILDDDGFGNVGLGIFQRIDAGGSGSVSKDQFVDYLQRIGFNDRSGLEFAGKAFSLVDFDLNDTLELNEFIAFVKITANLAAIRDTIAFFLEYVHVDGNHGIEFDELNAALGYLEQPALSNEECRVLSRVSGGGESFYMTDIINFVIISTLKDVVKDTVEYIEDDKKITYDLGPEYDA